MIFKKLLVLDVNGLLVDTYFHKQPLPDESPDAKVGNFYVYKRPFCEKFLQFCLDNFTVGVWSSAREHNVHNLVDYVFGDTKEKLAFIWHQTDCTDVGLKSPDNQFKPLFLKELSKLWKTVKVGLPWSEGDYGPSNTLLVDDTPYKAILNPPNTAIFPRSYTVRDHGDNFLGGALRSYLEGLCDASSVQAYVESNPFGEPSITPASPLWSHVSGVVLKAKNVLNIVADGIAQIMPVEVVNDEASKEDKSNQRQNGKGKHPLDLSESDEAVSDNGEKEGNPKRRKNRKRKNCSNLSQFTINHAQLSDVNVPWESVEVQASELESNGNMLEPLESGVRVHDSTSCYQQVHETSNLGSQGMVDRPLDQGCSNLDQPLRDKEIPSKVVNQNSFPSGPGELYTRHQDRLSSFSELGNRDKAGEKHCGNIGVQYLEWGHHETHEAANQAANSKHGDLKEVNKEHKQVNQGRSSHHESESLEKLHEPISDDGLNASGPDCMQGERNSNELLCERLQMRDTSFACGSNDNHASQGHGRFGYRRSHKHRGFGRHWHTSRNYTSRVSFRGDHGWKNEGGNPRDGRTNLPLPNYLDHRGNQFIDRKQTKDYNRHNSGRENRNKPSFGYARHQYKSWADGPVNASTQFSWESSVSDSKTWIPSQQECRQAMTNEAFSANASIQVPVSNLSTRPFNKVSAPPFNRHRDTAGRVLEYDERGRVQDGVTSHTWHQGLHPGPVYENSNFWSERAQHPNVNVHNPDANVAKQPKGWWGDKRQRLDYASDEAGASSKPHANAGAFGWPYGGQHGGSRKAYQTADTSSQPYRNAGARQPYIGHHVASTRPYPRHRDSHRARHSDGDKYVQIPPPGGFSRTMQSQEGRNL